MLGTENLTKFKERRENAYFANSCSQEVGRKNLDLFAKRFGIKDTPDLYRKLRYKDNTIEQGVWSEAHLIYDLHVGVWEKKYKYVHLINGVRVKENRIHELPVADSRLTAYDVTDVILCVDKVLSENAHITLCPESRDLLVVALTNFFLLQVGYPMVVGSNIAETGLSEESLHADVLDVLNIWDAAEGIPKMAGFYGVDNA